MTILAAIVGFALALFGALVIIEMGARHVYDYEVTSTKFVLRLFGRVPIYQIVLADIADARLLTFSVRRPGALFTTLRIGNRIFGRSVVIERRHGFPRYVVVTPNDPEEMIAKLHATRDVTVQGR